ncbi:hypothetical protein J2128_002192 [Methanomicrobium sp. W14]|nr:hypothetical protein [Methanomicrobium sp. W14]
MKNEKKGRFDNKFFYKSSFLEISKNLGLFLADRMPLSIKLYTVYLCAFLAKRRDKSDYLNIMNKKNDDNLIRLKYHNKNAVSYISGA